MITRRASRAAALLLTLVVALVALGTGPARAIHHGTPTSTERHPWMVALTDPAGTQFCGGAVLRGRFVLTAAHCVINRSSTSLRVVVGRTDLRTGEGRVVRVDEVWIHPAYEEVALGVDLALLTLRTPVETGSIRLAVRGTPDDEVGDRARVLGWGRTEDEPTGSPVLRRTALLLAELEGCAPYTLPGEDPRERICGLPPGDGEESICPGDSGGPLVAGRRVIGVVSSGNKFCDSQFPVSVFTRVSTATKSLRAHMDAAGG